MMISKVGCFIKQIKNKRRMRMDSLRAKKQILEFKKVPNYSIRSRDMIRLGVECILLCKKNDLNKKSKIRANKHREE